MKYGFLMFMPINQGCYYNIEVTSYNGMENGNTATISRFVNLIQIEGAKKKGSKKGSGLHLWIFQNFDFLTK